MYALATDLRADAGTGVEKGTVPIVSAVPTRMRSDTSSCQEAPPAKKARAKAPVSDDRTFPAAELQAGKHVECGTRLHIGVQAVTNSVTSDDPVPDMFASTAETCFSSQSVQCDGCVEGVGERNPSQLEEFKWLKRRLGKLMAQQAKLVQRRTALRKVSLDLACCMAHVSAAFLRFVAPMLAHACTHTQQRVMPIARAADRREHVTPDAVHDTRNHH